MDDTGGFALNLMAVLVVVSLAYSGPPSVDATARLAHLGILSLLAPFTLGLVRTTTANPAAGEGALIAAALLGLNPASAQALTEPSDLRLLFGLLGMLSGFVVYQRKLSGRARWTYLLPVGAAALSHPVALAFAPLLFAYVLLFEERATRQAIPGILARCAPAAAASLLALLDQGGRAALRGALSQDRVPLALAVVAVAALLGLFVWATLRENRRPLAFGVAWVLLLFAVAPLQPVAAGAGAALAGAWAVARILSAAPESRRWLVTAGCAALLAACGTAATQRAGGESAREDRGSGSADSLVSASMTAEQWLNLSLHAYQRGRYLESIAAAQTALRLKPDYADAHNNVAAAYSALHLWELAIPAAQEALRIKPDFTLARNNLNWALEQRRLGTR